MPFPSPSTFPSPSLYPSVPVPSSPATPEFSVETTYFSKYNGIILNQNQPPALVTDYKSMYGTTYIQEFFLPSDYIRGFDSDEQRIPALTGFQLFVGVDDGAADKATLSYTLQYQIFGTGWIDLTSDTATGCHASGNKVWMDVLFNEPVEIPEELLSSRFRIKFQSNDSIGLNKVWYSIPNPLQTLGFAKAYAADGLTPLTRGGNEFSFNFRLLALTADNGIDFLGNRYRAAVVSATGDNVSTTDNSTIDKFWLSKPNPSRFAVESLYFDVRPTTEITYGLTNEIVNSTFELDLGGWAASGAGELYPSGFLFPSNTLYPDGSGLFAQQSGWSSVGTNSARFKSGFLNNGDSTVVSTYPNNGLSVVPGKPISASIVVNGLTIPAGCQVTLQIDWRDGLQALISSTVSTAKTATGVSTISIVNAIAPTNASYANLTVTLKNISGGAGQIIDTYIDAALFVQSATLPAYFDGTFPGYEWTGQAFASTSVQVIQPSPTDELAVVDSILIDPLTPGVYFQIYYSDEGDPGTSIDDWDNKLWTHVPQTYRMTKRETHILPQPIQAKYIKIEFVQLQAKYYAPGNFAKAISYKKHPKWVLDYFLLRNDWQQKRSQNVAGSIGVTYNSLDLAYNYFLDDLNQEPDVPSASDPAFINQVNNFLAASNDDSDKIDPITLSKIRIAFEPYTQHPSAFAKTDNLLGAISQGLALNSTADYPVESNTLTPVDISDVSTLRRESVIFEQTFPVMFFYLTCRHKYREVSAELTHDRAYFAGINEIAFQRERYSVAHDTPQYIEPGADLFNIERNDFVNSSGSLVVG